MEEIEVSSAFEILLEELENIPVEVGRGLNAARLESTDLTQGELSVVKCSHDSSSTGRSQVKCKKVLFHLQLTYSIKLLL